jgi:hypothetical protein
VADGGQGLWLIDWVIIATAVEAIALIGLRAVTQRGVHTRELIAFLGAGLALLLAVRLAMAGASVAQLALPLLAALGLHIWLLAQRWQR